MSILLSAVEFHFLIFDCPNTVYMQTNFPKMYYFCLKSDVSTDFRSVSRRNCHEIKSFDNHFSEFFCNHNFTKLNLTTNHQMALPGLSSCVLILVVLISKCYTLGMFFLLFWFRTLIKMRLRVVNEAITY